MSHFSYRLQSHDLLPHKKGIIILWNKSLCLLEVLAIAACCLPVLFNSGWQLVTWCWLGWMMELCITAETQRIDIKSLAFVPIAVELHALSASWGNMKRESRSRGGIPWPQVNYSYWPAMLEMLPLDTCSMWKILLKLGMPCSFLIFELSFYFQ